MMTGARLRQLFLEYFSVLGHAVLPSASLIPEHDPSVLFTTAGMHPLVQHLLGTPHPLGRKLASVQKCLRTGDLALVGNSTHLTFFEMLGNWSLGGYFKEEAISMSFEFLTSDRWLKIPVSKLAVTCFSGDSDAPRDDESARAWQRLGIPKDRIFFFGKASNWWGPPGTTGPCGPDTEMFFDTGRGSPEAVPNDGSERFVEIWNDVFMEYEKTSDGSFQSLKQRNVDTGMGLERAVAVLSGAESVYETDLMAPLTTGIRGLLRQPDERNLRIASDHLRAAVFVLAEPRGIVPSNREQGYVLRRLIRRALRALQVQGADPSAVRLILGEASLQVGKIYGDQYPEVRENDAVQRELGQEFDRYLDVVRHAEDLLTKRRKKGAWSISGAEAFVIYQESGAHPDLLRSLGAAHGITVELHGFDQEVKTHQDVSRSGVSERFAGGLADHGERTVRMHTATHLLHEALRRVLGPHVEQRGSNITSERLRFDFLHPRKMTADELRSVTELVNAQIANDLPVNVTIMSPVEAKAAGARGLFGEKYGASVSVYAIGNFSKEICGGPHVPTTKAIGRLRIVKEEGLAAGVRRIRAIVEDP